MKKNLVIACFLTLSYLEADVSLSSLVEYNKIICLEHLEKATDAEFWNTFLKGQAKLFFDSEFLWFAKGIWWQQAKNILEIGSGNGVYLYELSQQFPNKIFKGIEKLPESVQQANKHYAGTNVIFQKGDAEIFDNKLIGSADIVLFRLTLQHLKDSTAALKNAAEYLSSNGYILIIDSCDMVKENSHPILAIDEALKLVAEAQEKEGKGNRKVTFELLQALETEKSPLSALYEVVSSNLDIHGNILSNSIRFKGEKNRILYFNHSLLFLKLLHRTYHIPVDLNRGYDELRDYLDNENAWTSPAMHFLVLKKKKCPL